MSRVVLVAGGVAASATAGALVAMGRRIGSVAEPFAAMGELLVERAPLVGTSSVFAGVVVHVLAVAVWTLVFVWLVARLNRWLLPAIIVGAANFFASWAVARTAGVGVASVLPLGDRLTLSAILAVSLLVGMRYARSSTTND